MKLEIFIQERIGKHGKPFSIYKLKTMNDNYSLDDLLNYKDVGKYGKFENHPRITKEGRILRKYWIDELPQILNLLKGDLRLIGVRPTTRDIFERLPIDLKEERIKYRPALISQLYAYEFNGLEQRMESERKYFELKKKNPIKTDLIYLYKILYNIFFKGARGA